MSTTISDSVPKHQDYVAMLEIWQQMRATSSGERAVKAAGTTYLPKTQGQAADKTFGKDNYDAYKMRAIYYEFVKTTQTDMMGLLTKEPTVYEIPERLELYRENATAFGDVEHLERRIYEQQLITSRLGLLLDIQVDDGADTMPVTVITAAERVVNWDDDNEPPRWIVLDESGLRQIEGGLKREDVTEFLLLALDANDHYYTYRFKSWLDGFDINDPGPESPVEDIGQIGAIVYPKIMNKTIDVIPFSFVNATSITPDVEMPAFASLSNLTLATYRGSADYRQTLFMQGQETLFVRGFSTEESADLVMGAGSYIASQNGESNAEFIGISALGLEETRESQESLKKECKNLGIELMENAAESGNALNTRLSLRTASLSDLSQVAASAIRQQLQYVARWIGLSDTDVESIKVKAATDFTDSTKTTKEMLELWSVVQQAGMTIEDYHEWLAVNDFTTDDFEDWHAKVQEIGALSFGTPEGE